MSISQEIAEKSVLATLAAIEIYNKPDFNYREETFAILMTNAWELLIKAQYIQSNSDDPKSVIEYQTIKDKYGNSTKQPKLNRSGNAITFGLDNLLEKIYSESRHGLTRACYDNILLLIEVRDNAIHFINKDLFFAKRVQEIGTASLKNYLWLIAKWFQIDLSRYNFYLMPISFYHGFEAIESSSVNPYNEQTKNFLKYLESVENNHKLDEITSQNVTLTLETRFVRSNEVVAMSFKWTDDPNAPTVTIKEEDALKRTPFDYKQLTDKLRERYLDFRENEKYHQIRKQFESNPKYCIERRLNPKNPRSSMQRFFSTEIIKEFDKHYTKK